MSCCSGLWPKYSQSQNLVVQFTFDPKSIDPTSLPADLSLGKDPRLPLLAELHLLHHGVDLLRAVLLPPGRTLLRFVQGPRRLGAHLLHQQRPLLAQRSETGLCADRRGRTHTLVNIDIIGSEGRALRLAESTDRQPAASPPAA